MYEDATTKEEALDVKTLAASHLMYKIGKIFVHCSEIASVGLRGRHRRAPPRSQFFCFDIHFFRNVAISLCYVTINLHAEF